MCHQAVPSPRTQNQPKQMCCLAVINHPPSGFWKNSRNAEFQEIKQCTSIQFTIHHILLTIQIKQRSLAPLTWILLPKTLTLESSFQPPMVSLDFLSKFSCSTSIFHTTPSLNSLTIVTEQLQAQKPFSLSLILSLIALNFELMVPKRKMA